MTIEDSREEEEGQPSSSSITEHELEECQRANATGRPAGGVRSWPVAAA